MDESLCPADANHAVELCADLVHCWLEFDGHTTSVGRALGGWQLRMSCNPWMERYQLTSKLRLPFCIVYF